MYDLENDHVHLILLVYIQMKNLNFKNLCLDINPMILKLIKLVVFLLKYNNYQVHNYHKVHLMYF